VITKEVGSREVVVALKVNREVFGQAQALKHQVGDYPSSMQLGGQHLLALSSKLPIFQQISASVLIHNQRACSGLRRRKLTCGDDLFPESDTHSCRLSQRGQLPREVLAVGVLYILCCFHYSLVTSYLLIYTDVVKRNKKSQQTVEKEDVVPSRRSRLKRPPRDLARFIRLANLVPEGTWLPPDLIPNLGSSGEINIGTTWPELLERIQELPEPVRAELMAASNVVPPPEELARGGFYSDQNLTNIFRFGEVLQHYEEIRVAYYNLRGLTRGTASLDPLENLLHALLHAELPYLRRCAYEKCGKIFYAGRSLQPGCKPAHSSALRKQRKRDIDRLNKQLERNRKKKRASKRA
jgi:hypothetical protein